MTVTLSDHVQALVEAEAANSGFSSVDAYVEACVLLRLSQQPGYEVDAAVMKAAVEEGLRSAREEPLMDGETFWNEFEEHKKRWRAERAA
jgi:hypothetical protein